MRYMRRSRFVRLVVLPFTLALFLSACTSYVTMDRPFEQSFAQQEPGHLRVTLNDGSRLVVRHPRIKADSLVGFAEDSWDKRERVYTDSVRVAFAEISGVEVKRTDALKSLGVPLGLFAILFVAACAGGGDGSFAVC